MKQTNNKNYEVFVRNNNKDIIYQKKGTKEEAEKILLDKIIEQSKAMGFIKIKSEKEDTEKIINTLEELGCKFSKKVKEKYKKI